MSPDEARRLAASTRRSNFTHETGEAQCDGCGEWVLVVIKFLLFGSSFKVELCPRCCARADQLANRESEG